MKCTKCGFISFDFNQVCPKCSKGLADEQRRLNLPSFRPEPPMLLGRLLGENYEDAEVEIVTDHPAVMEDTFQSADSDIDDSLSGINEDMLSSEDKEDLDDLTLGLEEHTPSSEEGGEDYLPDLEGDSFEESNEAVTIDKGDDLILEESMIEMKGKEEIGEGEISFNLDDISFDDLDSKDTGDSGLEIDLKDKRSGKEDAPVVETDNLKYSGTMESFYLDSDAEGLTKEIDMKKFRKGLGKRDKKPE
ncbi:MAG: hypothetical protein JW944_06520 [Deltaproteobacteria bacterium]|nr:hypothetical protein [Deltaproteobacteria bacterium]